MDKRTFLKTGVIAGVSGLITNDLFASKNKAQAPVKGIDTFTDDKGVYVLPPLPFATDALEPFIDKQTVELHHGKHHAGYVKGLNAAVTKIQEALQSGDFGIIKYWEKELAFHGAGHFLHTLYWNNLNKDKQKRSEKLDKALADSFGSFDNFKKYFSASTAAVEGGGWGILGYQAETRKLVVLQAEIHQNLSQMITVPIMVCDVWEHAYYLKYQNRRAEYIDAFFNIINWDIVSKRFDILAA